MADEKDKRIDQLPAVSVLDLTSLLAMQQGTEAKKVTLQQLLDYLNANVDAGNAVLYTAQNPSHAQRHQARVNLGIGKTVTNVALTNASAATGDYRKRKELQVSATNPNAAGGSLYRGYIEENQDQSVYLYDIEAETGEKDEYDLSGIVSAEAVSLRPQDYLITKTGDLYRVEQDAVGSPLRKAFLFALPGGGSVEGAVLYTEQTLTEEQQRQARGNIGAVSNISWVILDDILSFRYMIGERYLSSDFKLVRYDANQSGLTDDEKAQARTNIGAVSPGDLDTAVETALTEAKESGEFDGPPGEAGPKGDPFTYEDFTPEQLEALTGPEGPAGKTPERGVDYWTEADKAEIVEEVCEEIPCGLVNTASGSPITLTDATDLKLRGLRLFGKTTQDGTPSPDAPVELVSAGDGGSIAVTVTGKNLLNYNEWKKAKVLNGTAVWENNGVTLTATGDDCYISFMAGTGFQKGAHIPVVEGETITMSWKETTNTPGSVFIFPNGQVDGLAQVSNAKAKQLSYTVKPGVTFVTFRFGVSAAGNTISYKNIQIERGFSVTEYEPYKESQILTVSTPLGLPGIPVTSGGNYTDETGQQWICDEVDFGRGVYVQRMDKEILTGDEEWKGNWPEDPYFYLSFPEKVLGKDNLLCDAFIIGSTAAYPKVQCNLLNNNVLFMLGDKPPAGVTDITTWKKWLSSNPVTMVYPLAAPIETPLSAEELAAYAALHTNYPNTTILNDAGAGMEVTYVADTKLYIDNKIAALASAIVSN